MKLLKPILTAVICYGVLTISFAGSFPRAVEQLKDAAGAELNSAKELSGAELQNLKGADYTAYRKYLTDKCLPLAHKPEKETDSALKEMEKQDPVKYRAYSECFKGEEIITSGSYDELSPETKKLLNRDFAPYDKIDTGTIINILTFIGTTLVKVIKGGQIVNHNAYGCVWPKDADWTQFNWKKQAIYVFNYKKMIMFGSLTAIDATVAVSFKYDGQYGGKGKFLGNIQVVAEKCMTAFSHSISVTAELPPSSMENLQPQTPQNPVAGIDLNLSWLVSYMFPSYSLYKYQIQGFGKMIDKNTGLEPFKPTIIDLKK